MISVSSINPLSLSMTVPCLRDFLVAGEWAWSLCMGCGCGGLRELLSHAQEWEDSDKEEEVEGNDEENWKMKRNSE